MPGKIPDDVQDWCYELAKNIPERRLSSEERRVLEDMLNHPTMQTAIANAFRGIMVKRERLMTLDLLKLEDASSGLRIQGEVSGAIGIMGAIWENAYSAE